MRGTAPDSHCVPTNTMVQMPISLRTIGLRERGGLLSTVLLSLLLVGGLALSGCTSTIEMQSDTPDEGIAIDGNIGDWTQHLQSVEGENLSVGVLNDEEALYVAATTRDIDLVRQIVTQGLVLWIDGEGGTEETFGVQYPVAMADDSVLQPPEADQAADDLTFLREQFEASRAELEVRDADETRRYAVDDAGGIEASANLDEAGVFTYEIKIDLQTDETTRYAVDAGPGSTIGIGWVTEMPDRTPELAEEEGERPPGGGMGGGGMGGGAPGGGADPSMMEMPETGSEGLELWAEVTLVE